MKLYLLLLAFLGSSVFAMGADQLAVLTYYWPGEAGGRYSVDGVKLRPGDAAVDFNAVPKGTRLQLVGREGTVNVIAIDRGGQDVLTRKAAKAFGSGVLVIDIWVSCASEGRSRAALLGTGCVTIRNADGSSFTSPNAVILVRKPDLDGLSRAASGKKYFRVSNPVIRTAQL
jgi:hypothetical protein